MTNSNKQDDQIITSLKNKPNTVLATSILGAVIGVFIPIYLISAGPFESFGIWPTQAETAVLIFLYLAGLIIQLLALGLLRKWLKLVPIIALVPNIFLLFTVLISAQ